MIPKKSFYTYCRVPMCKNTTKSAPNKHFFHVPKNPSVREKWCKTMRQDESCKPLADKSVYYCCQDHFNMEQDKKPFYRYCLVPMCESTIISTPDKVFFSVPRGAKIREQWCKVMGRYEVSPTSHLHCCEDHFDLEEDTENYMEYKIMHLIEGKRVFLRLKKGVLPHIFDCQKKSDPIEYMNLTERKILKTCHETLNVQPVQKIEQDAIEQKVIERPETTASVIDSKSVVNQITYKKAADVNWQIDVDVEISHLVSEINDFKHQQEFVVKEEKDFIKSELKDEGEPHLDIAIVNVKSEVDWCIQDSVLQNFDDVTDGHQKEQIISYNDLKDGCRQTCPRCGKHFLDTYELTKHNITHLVVELPLLKRQI